MEKKSKNLTYIGFALKARRLCCGVNAIASVTRNAYLLIVCYSASENTLSDSVKLSAKLRVPLLMTNDIKIEDIVKKPNCKLILVQDKNLAKAITDNLDSYFIKYSGGKE